MDYKEQERKLDCVPKRCQMAEPEESDCSLRPCGPGGSVTGQQISTDTVLLGHLAISRFIDCHNFGVGRCYGI
jgi:hypothetical protein